MDSFRIAGKSVFNIFQKPGSNNCVNLNISQEQYCPRSTMKRRMRMDFSMSRTVGKTHSGARCCHSQVSFILYHFKLTSQNLSPVSQDLNSPGIMPMIYDLVVFLVHVYSNSAIEMVSTTESN